MQLIIKKIKYCKHPEDTIYDLGERESCNGTMHSWVCSICGSIRMKDDEGDSWGFAKLINKLIKEIE